MEGAPTRNPHRASARKPRYHQGWNSPVPRDVDRWGMGGFVAEAPPLLLLSLACLWPSEARVCSPHTGRVTVYLPGLPRTPEATQRRRKRRNSPAARPRPWVVTAGCRHWCVFVRVTVTIEPEGSSNSHWQSPRPGEMTIVTRRRRRRRYAARNPSS